MISAASVGGAGAAGSYYTRDNYYSAEDLEQSSQWFGVGAEAAGLAGPVSIDTFTAVLEGRLPDGSVIGNGQTGTHRAGMDLTFSAPKSLSMLAYVGGDTRLLDANMAAVKATLAWAEKNLAEARTGAGGANVVKTGNLLVALFQHDTSRNLDPQAHVHAVIANATQTVRRQMARASQRQAVVEQHPARLDLSRLSSRRRDQARLRDRQCRQTRQLRDRRCRPQRGRSVQHAPRRNPRNRSGETRQSRKRQSADAPSDRTANTRSQAGHRQSRRVATKLARPRRGKRHRFINLW